MVVDEETGRTVKDRVWAGGDIVTGAATVISAMGAGKRARSLYRYVFEGIGILLHKLFVILSHCYNQGLFLLSPDIDFKAAENRYFNRFMSHKPFNINTKIL